MVAQQQQYALQGSIYEDMWDVEVPDVPGERGTFRAYLRVANE